MRSGGELACLLAKLDNQTARYNEGEAQPGWNGHVLSENHTTDKNSDQREESNVNSKNTARKANGSADTIESFRLGWKAVDLFGVLAGNETGDVRRQCVDELARPCKTLSAFIEELVTTDDKAAGEIL